MLFTAKQIAPNGQPRCLGIRGAARRGVVGGAARPARRGVQSPDTTATERGFVRPSPTCYMLAGLVDRLAETVLSVDGGDPRAQCTVGARNRGELAGLSVGAKFFTPNLVIGLTIMSVGVVLLLDTLGIRDALELRYFPPDVPSAQPRGAAFPAGRSGC